MHKGPEKLFWIMF